MEQTKWSENVILVDAGYVDAVAFNLTVNFERMLNRPIPRADLAHWLVCVALDGGLSEGLHDVQVVFVHDREHKRMEYFAPSDFVGEIDGKAFLDEKLGEFKMCAVQTEQPVTLEDLFLQSLETLADSKDINRLIVIPDMERCGDRVRSVLGRTDGKELTALVMEPGAWGRNVRQEILGYSLMSALGIRGDEFK